MFRSCNFTPLLNDLMVCRRSGSSFLYKMREREADVPLEEKLDEDILVALVMVDANERPEATDSGDGIIEVPLDCFEIGNVEIGEDEDVESSKM